MGSPPSWALMSIPRRSKQSSNERDRLVMISPTFSPLYNNSISQSFLPAVAGKLIILNHGPPFPGGGIQREKGPCILCETILAKEDNIFPAIGQGDFKTFRLPEKFGVGGTACAYFFHSRYPFSPRRGAQLIFAR